MKDALVHGISVTLPPPLIPYLPGENLRSTGVLLRDTKLNSDTDIPILSLLGFPQFGCVEHAEVNETRTDKRSRAEKNHNSATFTCVVHPAPQRYDDYEYD